MSSIKLPAPDSYTVQELADHWGCPVELVNDFIDEQRSLRLGRRVRDYPGTFSVVLVSETDNALFDAMTAAIYRLVSQPMAPGGGIVNLDEIFEFGVIIYQDDIGVKFYKRLSKYAQGQTVKTLDGSIYIYEDTINRLDATAFERAIENHPRNRETLNRKNRRRFPSIDSRADAVMHAVQTRPNGQYEFCVTGQDFEGNRFLRMQMDIRGKSCIIWPLLRNGFSVIPNEEKERFEIKAGNQNVAEQGYMGLEKPTGNQIEADDSDTKNQFDSLIKAKQGRDNANAKKSLEAKTKWLPLILEVEKKLEKHENAKGKITMSCRHVANKNEEINQGTLRNHYNKYTKNPSDYE